jgi:hypothetical protein
MAKDRGHPDQFLEKLVDTPHVGLIEKCPPFIEYFLNAREVPVPKDGDHAQLPQYRK